LKEFNSPRTDDGTSFMSGMAQDFRYVTLRMDGYLSLLGFVVGVEIHFP